MNTKRESDLLITSKITDRIGGHKVLLPINQDYDKISERNKTLVICFHKKKKTKVIREIMQDNSMCM